MIKVNPGTPSHVSKRVPRDLNRVHPSNKENLHTHTSPHTLQSFYAMWEYVSRNQTREITLLSHNR